MILIMKREEPWELLRYRKQKYASYAGMPSNVKAIVKRSLAEEQGYLCAYCMSRLREAELDSPGNTDVTIEHWKPQSRKTKNPEREALDYLNMLAVCNGNRGHPLNEMTCDAARGDKPLKVNPLQKETLCGIHYRANGDIYSDDPDVDKDLTVTLNLNCSAVSLPERRKKALEELFGFIETKYRGKEASEEWLQKLLNRLESQEGKKTPYVGVLIDWLRKRLQR